MKASTKYTVLIFLLLTYCFSIGQQYFVVADVNQNEEGSFSAKYGQELTTNTANYFAVHTALESVSTIQHFIPFNESIDKFAQFAATIDLAHVQSLSFKQYFTSLLNDLIGTGKADGIFPFHYHW